MKQLLNKNSILPLMKHKVITGEGRHRRLHRTPLPPRIQPPSRFIQGCHILEKCETLRVKVGIYKGILSQSIKNIITHMFRMFCFRFL
jgi:hypothetical protein